MFSEVNRERHRENKAPVRQNVAQQQVLVPFRIDDAHARELARVSDVLDTLPQVAAMVVRDVAAQRSRQCGRPGMSGEQVLRCLVLMQMTKITYRQLAFHLRDSSTYRSFCRIGVADAPPRRSTLHENIKAVSASTLEKIHRAIVKKAVAQGIDDASTVRVDSTVVKSAIHHPNDSSLLYDGVRALTNCMDLAATLVSVGYSNHRKRAKRRALAIANAKSMEERVPLYRDLLQVSSWVLDYADGVVVALGRSKSPKATRIIAELTRLLPLVRRVFDQTQRRVLGDESVPSDDKVVSVFEPHSDIIVKDNRETLYGHKVFVATGTSGLLLDFEVVRGNPSDTSRAKPVLQRIQALAGKVPAEASFDGGFASQDNLKALKKMGVGDVAFSKRKGLRVEDMTRDKATYRRLRNFRAGVEATISWLKRSFGLDRCTWSGLASFEAYCWASVVSANLLIVARLSTG